MNAKDLFTDEEWKSGARKMILNNDTMKTATAVAMWPTPWYLRMFGVPAWRVKEKYWTGRPAVATHDRWKWGYYRDIHDYAEKHKK